MRAFLWSVEPAPFAAVPCSRTLVSLTCYCSAFLSATHSAKMASLQSISMRSAVRPVSRRCTDHAALFGISDGSNGHAQVLESTHTTQRRPYLFIWSQAVASRSTKLAVNAKVATKGKAATKNAAMVCVDWCVESGAEGPHTSPQLLAAAYAARPEQPVCEQGTTAGAA